MIDPQEPRKVTECCACNGEIYEGEPIYITVEGDICCRDIDCLLIATNSDQGIADRRRRW